MVESNKEIAKVGTRLKAEQDKIAKLQAFNLS